MKFIYIYIYIYIQIYTYKYIQLYNLRIYTGSILLDEDAVFVFKTSWSRPKYSLYSYVFRRHLQDVIVKINIFILVIHLQDVFNTSCKNVFKTSCQDVFKTFSNVFKTSSRHLAKTSSRHVQNVFKTSSRHLQDVFETSSRHLQDVLQRCLQNVFKTYHQVKLFLLTHFILLISFYTHWKHQKTRGFLCFQGVSKKIGGMKWVRKSSRRIQHVSKAYCKDCYQQKD